ncbi:MAG: lytic transglycosylase [Desulfobulbaceae bacterium]|nr:lytic transglycosylase [Desulfobulbaceae bacterium]
MKIDFGYELPRAKAPIFIVRLRPAHPEPSLHSAYPESRKLAYPESRKLAYLVEPCWLVPRILPALFLLLLVFFSSPIDAEAEKKKAADLVTDGQPIDLQHEKYQVLFKELKTEHHFTDSELQGIFSNQKISKRVLELMDSQWESKPYYEYAPLFVTNKTIASGRKKLHQYRALLDRVETTYGVDREIVIAIWGIETRYGTHQGAFNVLQTLNTLFDAYPRRSKFFRKQLVHFLVLCKENNVNPGTIKGSYAGAFGQTQFIPSSFQAYAVSFDGDDRRDVWNSVPDVLASIANYLKQYKWTLSAPMYAELGHELKDQQLIAAKLKGRKGRVEWQLVRELQNPDIPPSPNNRPLSIVGLELPPEAEQTMRYIAGYPNFQAITEWNHSNRYAMAVTELAEAFQKTEGGRRKTEN